MQRSPFESFEYEEVVACETVRKVYVSILDIFTHYYTQDIMCTIRKESVGVISEETPTVSYSTIRYEDLEKLRMHKVPKEIDDILLQEA